MFQCTTLVHAQPGAILDCSRTVLATSVNVCHSRTVLCKQGQKFLKKESDVGMLLTGKQSTEQAACRDGAHWYTKHRNKLHVGMLLTGLQKTNKLHVGYHQCDETIQQFLALHQ